MSPRRVRRRVGEPTPARAGRVLPAGLEIGADGEWVVRTVTASGATKTYRCPGCDHEIPPSWPHVVAWPVDRPEDRRHWHTPCWRAREHRRVRGVRLGGGPGRG